MVLRNGRRRIVTSICYCQHIIFKHHFANDIREVLAVGSGL